MKRQLRLLPWNNSHHTLTEFASSSERQDNEKKTGNIFLKIGLYIVLTLEPFTKLNGTTSLRKI